MTSSGAATGSIVRAPSTKPSRVADAPGLDELTAELDTDFVPTGLFAEPRDWGGGEAGEIGASHVGATPTGLRQLTLRHLPWGEQVITAVVGLDFLANQGSETW